MFLLCCLFACFSLGFAAPDLKAMTHYTMLSYAASCRQGLNNWTCFWCTHLPDLPPVNVVAVFESDGNYGTYGYIGSSKDAITISFRGSESLENWLHDLNFIKTPYPNRPTIEVHEGFLSAYQQVRDIIHHYGKQLRKQYPNLPITVTGHSLGAALSVLCAFDLVDSGIIPTNRINVVNLGQPRVGDAAFSATYNQLVGSTYRIVNSRDLVPHVPPDFFGFHHEPTEIWFPSNYTSWVVCDGSGEDPNCSDSLEIWDPIDHLHYLGFWSHDPGALAGHCGPLNL